MKSLVIESHADARTSMTNVLLAQGFNVTSASCSEDALQIVQNYEIDFILVNENDLKIPAQKMIRQIRVTGVRLPVVVAASSQYLTAVEALVAGADDYFAVTVQPAEITARVHAVVRRSNGFPSAKIDIGRLSLDLSKETVSVDEQLIKLTPKEYMVLEALALRRGRSVTKEQILSILYDSEREPELKIVDVFICKIRKKFSEISPELKIIDTVWGRGYTIYDSEKEAITDKVNNRSTTLQGKSKIQDRLNRPKICSTSLLSAA